MLTALARNWWVVGLRGVAAILFGMMAILWPGITLGVLIAFFGAYAVLDGSFSIVGALAGPSHDRWWYLFAGVAGIGVGVTAWVWPGLTALALLFMIATWALISGAAAMGTAIVVRERPAERWMLVLSGVVSILFGTVLLAFPGDGAVALVATIGFFSMVSGGTLIGFALRLRGLSRGRTPSGNGISRTTGPRALPQ